jgi:hypothetical protein
MLQNYMIMMGFPHVANEHYTRLLRGNPINNMLLPEYCHVMTTLYNVRDKGVHWTERLS